MSTTTRSTPTEFEQPVDSDTDTTGKRSHRALILAAACLVLASVAVYGWRWWTVGRFFETTDDAYLAADAVTVAPRVAGDITAVLVGDNAPVRAGQILARIDDRDYRASLAEAQAEITEARAALAVTAGQIGEQEGTIAQARADLDNDQARIRFDADERARATRLSATGAGTEEAAERADTSLREDTASLHHAQAALLTAEAHIRTLEAGSTYADASLAKARATADRARIDLDDTVIRAPVDGTVGDRTLRVGNYVQPGLGLLTIVPMGNGLYVTANFKETQLARMRPGQPVSILVDAVGSHVFEGHVGSFSPGTGSEFALLPPENATGNFTKIVQRVPVRVRLQPGDPAIGLLRAGLSAEVTVDSRPR